MKQWIGGANTQTLHWKTISIYLEEMLNEQNWINVELLEGNQCPNTVVGFPVFRSFWRIALAALTSSFLAATCSGGSLTLPPVCVLPASPIRRATTSSWPSCAATASGVNPSCITASRRRFLLRRTFKRTSTTTITGCLSLSISVCG